jgi:hypothetical protein
VSTQSVDKRRLAQCRNQRAKASTSPA